MSPMVGPGDNSSGRTGKQSKRQIDVRTSTVFRTSAQRFRIADDERSLAIIKIHTELSSNLPSPPGVTKMVGAGVIPLVGPGVIRVQGTRTSNERNAINTSLPASQGFRRRMQVADKRSLSQIQERPKPIVEHQAKRILLTWCHDHGGYWREFGGWSWHDMSSGRTSKHIERRIGVRANVECQPAEGQR